MAYKQTRPFRPELAGTTPYLCLANVRKGYGIAAKYSYALLDWQNTQQHRDRNFPAGVAVPVYWNWTGTVGGVKQNYGHIGIHLPDGRIWTDGRYFGSVDLVTSQYLASGSPSYLGWGESVNSTKVVQQVINNEDMIRDTDNEYARWALTTMHIRARLIGGDLQRLTRDEFRRSAVGQSWLGALEILEDDGEAKAALEKTRIGAIAVRDNWVKQINDLKAKVTELSAQAAAVAAENVQLKKRIAELEARPTTGGLTTEQATQLSETRSIVQYIKDLLNRIFK